MSLVGRVGVGLLLAALVAVASTSQLDARDRPPSPVLGYGLVAVAAVAALVASVLVLSLAVLGARVPMRPSWRVLMVATVVALFMGIAAVFLAPTIWERWPTGPSTVGCFQPRAYFEIRGWDKDAICSGAGPSAGHKTGHTGSGFGNSKAALILAAGASSLMLVVIGAAALMAIRRKRSESTGDEEPEDFVHALDESLEDLRRERDVRRAIVACYARMERALAGAGRARRAHEAPLEFLRRVLERVAREPGQVLTELFERARFSVEPMGEIEKRSAIAALEQLRGRVTR